MKKTEDMTIDEMFAEIDDLLSVVYNDDGTTIQPSKTESRSILEYLEEIYGPV